MLYSPHIYEKRSRKKEVKKLLSFPTPDIKVDAIFNGLSVEVNLNDNCDGLQLANCGFGSVSETAKTLVLSLEEAYLLAYILNCLTIHSTEAPLNCQELLAQAETINPAFIEHLAAYVYLKSKGWTVKSGIKFGGQFLIYKHGPSHYHASFVVNIQAAGLHRPAHMVKGAQRVAETSKKDVLLLEVDKPTDFKLNSPDDLGQITVSETIMRRFNLTSFVQKQV